MPPSRRHSPRQVGNDNPPPYFAKAERQFTSLQLSHAPIQKSKHASPAPFSPLSSNNPVSCAVACVQAHRHVWPIKLVAEPPIDWWCTLPRQTSKFVYILLVTHSSPHLVPLSHTQYSPSNFLISQRDSLCMLVAASDPTHRSFIQCLLLYGESELAICGVGG